MSELICEKEIELNDTDLNQNLVCVGTQMQGYDEEKCWSFPSRRISMCDLEY